MAGYAKACRKGPHMPVRHHRGTGGCACPCHFGNQRNRWYPDTRPAPSHTVGGPGYPGPAASFALSRHANELPERLEAAIGTGWVDRDEDPPDYDALLADAAATIRQLSRLPRHDPTAGTQFLMCALAPEGVKPHPLDTIPVALPPHVDVYGLLADACRFSGEGGSMYMPEGADAEALRKLAAKFERHREYARRPA